MARITVEDCLEELPNRFDLVMVATKRARDLSFGKEPLVPWENDKATVVALREIAAGLITKDMMEKPEEEDNGSEGSVEAAQDNQVVLAPQFGGGNIG